MRLSASLLLAALTGLASAYSQPLLVLLECLDRTGLSYSALDSPNFANASIPYNQRYDYVPAAIAYPASSAGVAVAVQCAASANTSVAARSGGHSYTATGLGGEDGSLVIDLSALKNISIAEDGVTATVQTGNRLGNVALGLYGLGKRALPHGTCPQVGTGGHISFGGFGLTSRQWGLTLDRVVGAEMVLANGSVVEVSATSYPDLYWAIRGSATSFGIVTAWRLATFAAPVTSTTFTYNFANHNTPAAAAAALVEFETFGQTCDGNLGLQLIVTSTVPWYVTGSYPGNATETEAAIAPLLKKLPTPSSKDVAEYGWIEYLEAVAGNNGNLNASSYPDTHDTFYCKSPIVPSSAPLTKAETLSYFKFLYDNINNGLSWFAEINLYGGQHSAIASVPSNATAYGNRDGLMTFQLYASSAGTNYTEFPEFGFDFVAGMVQNMIGPQRAEPFGFYPNYPDDRLPDGVWQQAYYGSNYPRLLSIKRQADPNSVFKYPQAIGQ